MDSLADNLEAGYGNLHRAVDKSKMLPTSEAWLVKITDPFHDNTAVPCAGVPDQFDGRTVIREIKETWTLSATTFGLGGIDPAETWNLNVAILPTMNYASTTRAELYPFGAVGHGTESNTTDDTAVAQIAICGHLNDSGDNETYPWPNPTLSNTSYSLGAVAGKKKYFSTSPWSNHYGLFGAISGQMQLPTDMRCVAIAFQLEDRTNQFYRQGLATCYKMNTNYDQNTRTMCHFFDNSVTSSVTRLTEDYLFQLPANYPEDVTNLPGTVSWDASEGCYVVGQFDPACLTQWCSYMDQRGYVGISAFSGVESTINGDAVISTAVLANPNGYLVPGWNSTPNVLFNEPFLPCATQTSGCILSGLNKNAVYELKIRAIYETVPDYTQADNLLAPTPSAPYDPTALQIYSDVVKMMPAGVPQRYNPWGEWFDYVMKLVAGAAPIVGAAVDSMGGMGLGSLTAAAVSSSAMYFQDKNAQAREMERAMKRKRTE
jgi:hypothetical protein